MCAFERSEKGMEFNMNKFNLEEEIICNFRVSSKRKKVWKVELDLLNNFIEICNKYKLTYFAIGGTLLGAIRHKGFIPWDDDIDIGMPREDYNKLLEIAKKEFKNPIFFQTPYNDKLFRGHAQLRNSNTTGILPVDIYEHYNQGIFIDIFPYDEYPKEKKDYNKQYKKLKIYEKIIRRYYSYGTSFKSKFISFIFARPLGNIIGIKRIYNKYEKECSKYNNTGSGIVSNLSLSYDRKLNNMNREDMYNLLKVKFENIYIYIPKNYDKILKESYGNYMICKKVNSTHGEVIFDTEVSYMDFIEKYKNNKIDITKIFFIEGDKNEGNK